MSATSSGTPAHPADLTDDQLAALDVSGSFRIFTRFDPYDLAKVADLIGIAPVFEPLDVHDVTLMTEARSGNTRLALVFAIQDGHRLCTQTLEPRQLIDFSLTGQQQARAILRAAHDLICATLENIAPISARQRG